MTFDYALGCFTVNRFSSNIKMVNMVTVFMLLYCFSRIYLMLCWFWVNCLDIDFFFPDMYSTFSLAVSCKIVLIVTL